ncbi:MAG: hypothetical protein WCF57_00700 [Pyrinomonadaceae bacterium]
MDMGGFISYTNRVHNDEPRPETPFIVRVINRPGSTEETLTAWDRSLVFPRESLTVFATAHEATGDAWRRIREAKQAFRQMERQEERR